MIFLLQVQVYNFDENKHGPDDVLVMGTDGLWDVTTDKEVADAVSAYLSSCDPSDPMRYAVCRIILYIRILFCYMLGRALCSMNYSFMNHMCDVLLSSACPLGGDTYLSLL